MLARIGSRLAIAVLASLALIVPSASASEIWLIAGVPVLNQDPQWHGIRADAADMWTADAPWQTVARNTRVVLFPPGVVLRAKDDDVLKQAFSDLKRRNIALALEMGLLTQTDSCRYRGEGYLDSVQTVKNALERIRRNGGELSYIAMDEPFYYAHQYSGPNACHEPTTEIARRVAATVAIARSIFPNVRIGDEEVVDASRPATDELAEWVDAYRAESAGYVTAIFFDRAGKGLGRSMLPVRCPTSMSSRAGSACRSRRCRTPPITLTPARFGILRGSSCNARLPPNEEGRTNDLERCQGDERQRRGPEKNHRQQAADAADKDHAPQQAE
jgi:hypothetical protein